METPLILQKVDPATVAQLLSVCPDPLGQGMTDIEAMAARSDCLRVTGPAGDLVMALQLRTGTERSVLWIAGAAGQGATDWTYNGLAVAEHKAAACGAQAVAFQTARRGLVRRAEASGYRVAGYILIKELQ